MMLVHQVVNHPQTKARTLAWLTGGEVHLKNLGHQFFGDTVAIIRDSNDNITRRD